MVSAAIPLSWQLQAVIILGSVLAEAKSFLIGSGREGGLRCLCVVLLLDSYV